MTMANDPDAGPSAHIIPSEGGPNWMGWFRVDDPPPLELAADGGLYVLDEGLDGSRRYLFVADGSFGG
jgi:hypothetical protein